MGRPCDCFCGGTSGGGGGGGGDGGDGSGGGGTSPPVVIIPSGERNQGPYKVYSGTKGVAFNSPEASGNVVNHQDEFIYSFSGAPTIQAFSDNIVLITSTVAVANGISGIIASRAGGSIGGGGGWNVWDYAAVVASGFPGSGVDVLGVGSNFIQLEGGRITGHGIAVFCHDDDWKNAGCTNWRCVDERTFASSGVDGTGSNFVSMGANQLGQIGRNGVSSGAIGDLGYFWQPGLIDEPVNNGGQPYQKLFLGAKCGMISSYDDPLGQISMLYDPETYMCVFGDPHQIGHVHSCYDPEISTPPIGISPPKVIRYPDCTPDAWLGEGFYGSDRIGRKAESAAGQPSNLFNSDTQFKEVTEAFPGFNISTNHNLPEEAFPQFATKLSMKTTSENWGLGNTSCSGTCITTQGTRKIFASRWDNRGDSLFHAWTGYSEPWVEANTNSCRDLNTAVGWKYLPHRFLVADSLGSNADSIFIFESAWPEAMTTLNTGGWNINWTHPEYQFSRSKFVPIFDCVGGIPTGGALSPGDSTALGHASSGDYIFIGPTVYTSESGAVGSHLQKYPPSIFTSAGAGGDPEASGSHIVAICNEHNTSIPPVVAGYADAGWPVWSGGRESTYLSSAFLPSGIEDCFIAPQDFTLFYSVYYSGDAITTFGSGWHYRS